MGMSDLNTNKPFTLAGTLKNLCACPQLIFSNRLAYIFDPLQTKLGPVVQSVVSLTSSLRAISLTILADSIYNFLKFFAEKM